MKLVKRIVKVESKNEKGEKVIKHFTNFSLIVEMEGNERSIPIQPVNFGNEQNRKNYNILSMCAEMEKEKEDNPLY